MKKSELLQFLKDKQYLEKQYVDTFSIKSDEIKELCLEFGWKPKMENLENGDYRIKFVDAESNEITDFSKFNLDSKYYQFSVQFQNKADLKKFQDLIPGLKEFNITLATREIYVESMDVCDVKNKKTASLPNHGHSQQSLSYFKEWRDMPEYYYSFAVDCYVKIQVFFNSKNFTREDISKLVDQTINENTDGFWYPKKDINDFNYYRVLGGNSDPKYPIFVVSKGRANLGDNHVSHWLSMMRIHHRICVEPDDAPNYYASDLAKSEYCHILEMDMSWKGKYNTLSNKLGNLNSTGSGAARNFCADLAISEGHKWCWILDDNVRAFFRIWRGRKLWAYTPEVFCSVERFVDRYTNIGLAGLNYSMFVVNQDHRPPFITNSKIYSFGLWNLECPFVKQEGRYNEDVIQSLKILEQGWVTVQWNCYTGNKLRTQLCKGGNTQEIYGKEFGGTFSKSQMLVERFPQYTKLVWKFGRWHHETDFTSFKQELKIKPEYEHLHDVDYNKIDENGAYIVRIPTELHHSENDNREYLEKHFPKGCPEDITHELMYCPEDRNNIELRNFWFDETPGPCNMIFNRPSDIISNQCIGTPATEILESDLFADEQTVSENKETTKETATEDLTDKLSVIASAVDSNIKQQIEEFNLDSL